MACGTRRAISPAVILLSTAPACRRWLAGFACAIALVTGAQAVAPFRFPTGQKNNQPLREEKSMKGYKLTAYRPERAAIHRKGPKEMPASYSRPIKGNQRPASRPAPFRYVSKGEGKPIRVNDRWDPARLATDRNLLPDRRHSAPY
jgi:hypothetical protein